MKTLTAAVLASLIMIRVYEPVSYANWDQKAKDLLTAWGDGAWHVRPRVSLILR